MNPFVKARPQHPLRAYEVDSRETGQTAEQIEVGDEQSVGLADPVRDGDDDVIDDRRTATVVAQQVVAQAVFVPTARPVDAALVLTKGLREKSRLGEKSGRAAIAFAATERLLEERRESVQPLRLSAHLVVEPKHLRDEAGS